MQTYWKITYKTNGREVAFGCFNKKEMVYEYLLILKYPNSEGTSELKIWQGEKDYTSTLNRFLCPKK